MKESKVIPIFRRWGMKVVTLVMILFGVSSLQSPLIAQEKVITLNLNAVTLKEALFKLRQETKVDLIYNEQDISPYTNINVRYSGQQIEKALESILKDTKLQFTIVKGVARIQPKANNPSSQKKGTAEQNPVVKGKVYSDSNKAISGATVKIVGSSKTALTEADGGFTIELDRMGQTLSISYLGFNDVQISAKNNMEIYLIQKSNVIDEVVSVGYGSQRRKDLTGSIASVDVNEVKNAPFVSIDQALSGKAAGVQVVQSDGSPGGVAKIRIRGGASLIGGNDPLYIIDGVQVPIRNRYIEAAADITNPVENLGGDDYAGATVGSAFGRGMNTLAGLNINDIESIDILKDASATAIYGSRAANGVVIITTKKGKHNQKPLFEANYYSAMSRAITEKILNRDQYIALTKEAAQNHIDHYTKIGLPINEAAPLIINDPSYFGTANTNWMDEVTRVGVTQNVDLSIRGGGTGSRYYTSVAYQGQSGVLKGTDFSRLSGKLNLDNEITQRFRFITNLDFGYTTNNVTNGIYGAALLAPPTEAPYGPDGKPRQFINAALGASNNSGIQNPLLLLNGVNRSRNAMLLGSVALEYDILKDLKFRSSASINYNAYNQENFIPSSVFIAGNTTLSQGGIATKGNTNQYDAFFENTLTWNKEFNENNRINVLAGTSWQKSVSKMFSASGQGFPDDYVLNGLSSAAIALPPKQTDLQNSLLSFYLRANYALKERYLLTLTGRSDESSKFPKNNRVGYFPSFGVAWRVSEEQFMKPLTWISELKLRASAGSTGTQNIADNLFYTLFTPGSYGGSNALLPTQLGNDAIRWETTYQKDAGLDFALFNNRVRGAFGYYSKESKDLLMAMPVPLSSGNTSALINFADIDNKGFEFDLRGDIIKTKNFQWNLAGNLSLNRSKVRSIKVDTQDPTQAGSDDPFYRSEFDLGNTILREGEPVGMIFGYSYLGLLRTQEQLDAYMQESLYHQFGILPALGIGDPYFATQTEGDYKGYWKKDIIGRAEPKYYGGITNTFNYKNFGLMSLFTFSVGGDLLYMPEMRNQSFSDRANRTVRAMDHYSNNNSTSDRPRAILGHQTIMGGTASSFAVYDASYLKLKSIMLNYQLPDSFLSKYKISNASAYFSVNNVFVITDYPGPDPEVSNDPYSLIGGYTDSANYPTMRQFSLGIRFGF